MMRYLLLFGMIIVVAGCDRKEVLEGERRKIDGIVYKDSDVFGGKILTDLPAPKSVRDFIDISGSKQHVASNYSLRGEPRIVWSARLGQAPILSNIIVSEGKLYAMNGKGELRCIDIKTGQLLWEKMVAPQLKEGRFVGGITLHDGVIYIGSNVNSLTAIDVKTQKVIWRKVLDNSVKGTPFYVNGKLIIVNANNDTFALNAKSGEAIWANVLEKSNISLTQLGTPAQYKNNVICVYSTGDIISFNLDSGAINWSETLVPHYMGNSSTVIPNISASPIVIGDKCLVVNSYSQMMLLDAATGLKIWSKDVGAISQPIVADNNCVFALSDTELLCISLESGDTVWKTDIKGLFKDKKEAQLTKWYGPRLINGEIWLFTNSAFVFKFDIKTGKCVQSQYIHHIRNITDPIVVDGTLYTAVGGRVYALR